MSSYRVSVGDATVRVKTFREVGPVVMEALTNLLAQDPEAAAEGATMANRAFSVSAVVDRDLGRVFAGHGCPSCGGTAPA